MNTWKDFFLCLDPIPVISRRMIIFLNIALIVIPLFNVIVWSLPETHFFTTMSNIMMFLGQPLEISTSGGLVNPSITPWTLASKGVMICSKLILLMPWIAGLFLLRLIFKNYQKGDVFIVQNAQYYIWISYCIFIHALVTGPMSKMLVIHASDGILHFNKHLVYLFNAGIDATAVFVGLIVQVISQVMLEGSRIREENQLTI